MGLADDIINGKYKSQYDKRKKKRQTNTAEIILNGTYKQPDYIKNNTLNDSKIYKTFTKEVNNSTSLKDLLTSNNEKASKNKVKFDSLFKVNNDNKTSSLMDIFNSNYERNIDKFNAMSNYNSNQTPNSFNSSLASNILGVKNAASSHIAPYSTKYISTKGVASNDSKYRVIGNTTKEGYKTTGRVYGDYFYQGFKNNKNLPIVEKNGKYYVYNENATNDILKYQDVDKMSFLSNEDEYDKAVKEGYKGQKDVRKISNQIKLDTSELTSKEREAYIDDIKRQEIAEEKKQKYDNRIKIGGAGLKGSLGELTNLFNEKYNKLDKEVISPIKNFGDNYEVGKLNNELALEYYKKMQGKENNVDELEKKVALYNSFNGDLLTNPGAGGTAIQNMNTQVESIKHQGATATILGGIGAGIGTIVNPGAGTIAGAKIGAGIGYTIGSTPYTYELEAGNQYKALLDMGVPEDVAKKYAKITGAVNAGIEGGENIIDLVTFGVSSLAGKGTSKISKEAVNEMVEEYGESTVKTWLKKKMGEETADKFINIAKTGVKSYVQNIGSEALEEMAQETTSIVGERKATKESGIERVATLKDDLERVKAAGVDSAISTAFTAPLSSAGGAIVTNIINNVSSKADNKTFEKNINKQIVEYEEKTGTKFTVDEKRQLLSGTINAIKDLKNQSKQVLTDEEKELSQQRFIYIANENDSSYRQELAKSSDVLNNSKAHHELFNLVAQISEDTDTTYRFTNDSKEEMINEKNKFIENFAKKENVSLEEARTIVKDLTIDGFVNENGEIIINADSSKALNVILGHETTHLLENTREYDDLQKLLFKLADTRGELNQLKENMTRLYEGTNANIDNEITSELAGEYLYTNQDFINNLASEQPNIFRKIYNYLKHIYKTITADTKEARQLEQVIYRYKQAYSKYSNINTKTSNNNIKETKYHISSNFSHEIDRALNGDLKSNNQVKARDYTPKILVDNGVNNLPMLITQNHIKSIIYSEAEAKKMGINIDKKANYHGLGKELLVKSIDNMDDPLAIYKKNDNNFIIITELKDKDGDNIIVPVQINGKGVYNDVYIDENHIKSVYGKTNLEVYLQKNKFMKIYEKKGTTLNERVQYSNISSSNNNLSQDAINVNSNNNNIKYSLSDNNGHILSKQQQEYFKNVIPELKDKNGNLKVLYHGTPNIFTQFNYDFIGSNGTALGKGFYLTDSRDIANSYVGSGDGHIMELYANIEKPMSLTELNISKSEYKKFIKEVDKVTEGQYLSDYGEVDYEGYDVVLNRALENYEYNDNDVDLIHDVFNTASLSWEEGFRLLKNTLGYDGVIQNNFGGTDAIVFVPTLPEQIKSIDNLNPTTNPDIMYSLSKSREDISTDGKYRIYGNKSLKHQAITQNQVESAIAPLQKEIKKLNDKIDDIVPITADSLQGLEQEYENRYRKISDGDVPVRKNLTIAESKQLDYLEGNTNLTNAQQTRLNELQKKENTNNIFEDAVYSPFADKDIVTVGNRKEKAYQYENPEVKPYFQEEAINMLNDLKNSIKGTKFVKGDISQNGNGNYKYGGITRHTNNDIAYLLDNFNYTYDDIEKGLNAIIEDHGKENIAVAKRIEFMLDERLREGYTDMYGYKIPANIGYRNILKEIDQRNNINSSKEYIRALEREAFKQAVIESNKEIEKELGYIPKDPTKESSYDDVLDLFLSKKSNKSIKEPDNNITKPKGKLRNFVDNKKAEVRSLVDTTNNLLINRNQEIDRLAKKSGNKNIKYAGDMLNSVAGEIEGEIYTAQTDNEGREVGRSLSSVFENAKKDGLYDAFNDYLENYSNIDRHKQGKGSKTPYDVSMALVKKYEKLHPEFKSYAEDVWNYGRNIKNNLVAAGLITQEFSDKLSNMYPHYIPYMENREMSNYYPDIKEAKPIGVIKRAIGKSSKLLSTEEALTKYTYAAKKAVRQNQLYQEIVSTLDDKVSIGADVRTDPTKLDDSLYKDENGSYLTAYFDGKQQSVRISDSLYKSLKNDLEHQVRELEEKLSLITKPLQKLSDVRRDILTTWNLSFIITNPIKDIQDAVFNSKYTTSMLKNYPSSFVELAKAKDPIARQFLTLYGSGNTQGNYSVDSGLNNENILKKGFKSLKNNKYLNVIPKLNNIVELAPRYAEFKASLENGATIPEAMYNAREITTNFNRGGVITKALNRNGATFLNASVQGFDKFIRNFSGENGAKGIVSSLMKATLFGVVPAVFNEVVFGSGEDKDDDYEALPNYIKDNYYLIKLSSGSNLDGNNIAYVNGSKFLRIPKGRVLSVFGSAARRTVELSQGDREAFNGFLENTITQIGVNDPSENNIFAPYIQAKNNKAWYGGDIVPSRLQDLAPAEQYDASIDKFSIWLGNKINKSPYKINYMLDQYSGGIGDAILPMITEESTSSANTVTEHLFAPIKDKFTVNSIDDNKYASDIYSLVDKMNTKPSSIKETDEYKLQMKYLSDSTSAMGKLYEERREVQADTTLSKSEKYAKVQSIQQQINSIAKEGLDNYKSVNRSGDYAMVGDQEYYKYTSDDGENKWSKTKEENANDLNSMGLNLQEKSSYYKANSDISSIRAKYKNSDAQASRKKEIVDVIKKANIPDDAKYNLYDKYYGSTDELNMMQKIGLSANAYLDYSAQDFTSDKDNNGKSISGSKKNKIFNYINSMNDASFEQKVILAKLQYNSYDDYNSEIIDYLNNNNDISFEDKKKILIKLGFEVDKNGNIKW